MYKQLSFNDLIASVINQIKQNTSVQCYDTPPANAESPLYYIEAVSKQAVQNKTMYVDNMGVYIHCIAEPSDSSVGVYDLINKVEEALTEEITLPEGYELLMQTSQGLLGIQTDETNEKHAVLSYEFRVCYGLKCKL